MATNENIDYGRLLESAHLTGYTAARACTALEKLLEDDRWKRVGDGFDDINKFLDSINLSQFKIQADQRKSLARKLADIEASQRATARALGVSDTTIRKDIGAIKVAEETPVQKPLPQVVVLEEDRQALFDESTTAATKVAPNEETSQRPDPLAMSGPDVASLAEKQATKAYDKAQLYGHDEGDEWYTPRWIFDALGIRFSIDVCAPLDLTHVTTPADRYFNESDDGLSQEWSGTIWCNPPYSKPAPWAERCVEHGDGLLLTHIPMNAEWCAKVWAACDGIRLFQAIEFVRPDGKTQRPGSWLQLSAFGPVARDALAAMQTPPDVAENPRRVPSPMWVRA
jgi:hypothetical protein